MRVSVYLCMYVCVCHACFGSVVGNKRKCDDRPQNSMYTDRATSVRLQSSIIGKAKNYVLQPLTDQYFFNDTA